ncbi:UNVERIFIED_CONTAM: oligosaccharide flippase family protein [Halobacillus marinus]
MKQKRNSISINILHLFYSTALSSILNACALIILASYLQSSQYGLFSFILAFAMVMGYFTDAGLSNIVLREGAKQVVTQEVLLSSYVKLRFLLLILTFFLGFITLHILYFDGPEIIQTGYLLIIPLVTGVALQSIGTTYFQLCEKMQYSGLIRLFSSCCLVLCMLTGMVLRFDPIWMCFLYGASYLFAGMFALVLVNRYVAISLKTPLHKGMFRNLWAFTIGGFLFVLLPHLGPLVLKSTLSLKEVGLFAVAYRIPQALQQVPFVVAGSYYPVLFRTFQNGEKKRNLDHRIIQTKIMTILGIVMTLPFFYLSDFIISVLFGESWKDASLPLKILSLMLVLQAVNIALADGLSSMEKQTQRAVIQVISIVTGIIIYILFSRSSGVFGAAVAGVCVEVTALIGFWICTAQRMSLLKRVILPYGIFISTGFLVVDFFDPASQVLALSFHGVTIVLLVFFDKDLSEKIMFISKRFILKYQTRKRRQVGGIENKRS